MSALFARKTAVAIVAAAAAATVALLHLAHAAPSFTRDTNPFYAQAVFDLAFDLPIPESIMDEEEPRENVEDHRPQQKQEEQQQEQEQRAPFEETRGPVWTNTISSSSVPGYSVRYKDARGALCDPDVKQYSGFLDTARDKHFFFWFFESRSKPQSDPLVLWLSGGPGCSSMTGLLAELGPCRLVDKGNSTERHPYSWTENANVLFLDQPIGAGFSYGSESSTTTAAAAEDVYAFFQLFYAEFPQYSKLDFHITGESYAGHYIPQIAGVIVEKNEQVPADADASRFHIPLRSVAIGNGFTDPLVQYKYYGEYACKNPYGPVFPQEECDSMTRAYDTCAKLIQKCYDNPSGLNCLPSSVYCNSKLVAPFQKTGLNIFDIRTKCENNHFCYNVMGYMETYLNRPDIRWELGVADRKFQSCNVALHSKFQFAGDWNRPYVRQVPKILAAGIRVLIYAGDADYSCNYMGNKAWTLQLEWPGQAEFNAAEDRLWPNEDKKLGELRTFENFSFLKLYNAGHMLPMDAPKTSQRMINAWFKEELRV